MSDVKFPGYKYDLGVSTYKGYEVGEGGYVYAEPGVHNNVALLDVASMHPTSIEELHLFGHYTERFSDIKRARLAIKHNDMETAGKLLDGKLKPYLEGASDEDKKNLQESLKIVINSVYGLTSATFNNKFRDIRNVDNIVAKRGALFMVDLMLYVQEQGYNVAHIKTDSIKIPDADQDIIDKVFDFGAEYGYEFEHETTYKTMALVNNAVYIAEDTDRDGNAYWSATGAMFQHPYVYSHLFGDGDLDLSDLFESRSVKVGHMYLDESGAEKPPTLVVDDGELVDVSQLHFLGRTGRFVPVKPDSGGGRLWRIADGKPYAVANTSGWLWKEAHLVKNMDEVDLGYYNRLKDQALDAINAVGSYVELIQASSLPNPPEYAGMVYRGEV